ncbi:hypothetical protein [Streptomyces sp. IB2014 016-6]|uniref:hypothetical protein n=1 Tax=Streptomyces sp. IB2014 016-6 TaxID=2517818 RepID=UPI0011C9D117|nr:hypothetical protein [Streptomyces sp. IB2014 016-6]TXL88419.1 hypothetical protein EW053_18710 [Streptomyces sp. IB2014 016-6]
MDRVGVGLAALGCAVVWLCAVPSVAFADRKEDDARVVYCLDPARGPDMVRAAVQLDVAKPVTGEPGRLLPGPNRIRTLTVEQWYDRHPKDFGRVCEAVMAARQDAPAPAKDEAGGGVRDSVLLAAVGVVFTLFVQFVERGTSRRGERLTALTGATGTFSYEAELYLTAWRENTRSPHGEVATARTALAVALRGLGLPGERGRAADDLGRTLPLPDPLEAVDAKSAGGARSWSPDERLAEIGRVRVELSATVAEARELTSWAPVWHLRRYVRRFRSSPPRTTSPTPSRTPDHEPRGGPTTGA